MNFWDRITGNDMTRELNAFEAHAQALPADYQAAWEQIKTQLWSYGDFTGRNLMPILDSVIGLLEETASEGLLVRDALGDDIPAFCSALVGNEGARSVRDKWREQLNQTIAKKLGNQESI